MRLQPEIGDPARRLAFPSLRSSSPARPARNDRVGNEGAVTPGSRLKKAGIEYGGAVGAGAVTGAIIGGPGGALAGTIIGAGVITAHLLINHPQATLDNGTSCFSRSMSRCILSPRLKPVTRFC